MKKQTNFAKKCCTYPSRTNETQAKKCSKQFLHEKVYIVGIEEFCTEKPHYEKQLRLNKKESNVSEYVLFVEAYAIIDQPIEIPSFEAQEQIYIIIAHNAQITLYFYDRPYFSIITCIMQQDSFLSFICSITDVKSTKLMLTMHLQEKGAHAEIVGYYWLKKDEQCALHVIQHHEAPHTTSNVAVNGVLFDSAKAVYDGSILIEKNAQNSVATQNNKNILMGKDTQAVSVPNLEVKTNEVICKHGSAVGNLDEAVIFYLQSRGISVETAKRLLLESFLYEPFKKCNKIVQESILKRLKYLR